VDCTDVRRRMYEQGDDPMDRRLREEMETHLSRCAPCAREWEDLRKNFETLGSLPTIPAPPGFLRAVREQIGKPSRAGRVKEWWTKPWKIGMPRELAGLVAASLLVVLLYHGYQRIPAVPGKPEVGAGSLAPSPVPLQAPTAPPPSSVLSLPEKKELPGDVQGMKGAPETEVLRLNVVLRVAGPSKKPDSPALAPAEAVGRADLAGEAPASGSGKTFAFREKAARKAPAPGASRQRPGAPTPVPEAALEAKSAPGKGPSKDRIEDAVAGPPAEAQSGPSEPGPNRAGLPSRDGEDPAARIEEWVLDAGGRVIEAGSRESGKNGRIIRAEVPVENYLFLVNNLSRLGDLDPPPVHPARGKDRETVLVVIQLLFP